VSESINTYIGELVGLVDINTLQVGHHPVVVGEVSDLVHALGGQRMHVLNHHATAGLTRTLLKDDLQHTINTITNFKSAKNLVAR
jgi:hypothetical protein